MITLTWTDLILYYIGIVISIYVGYVIGNEHNHLAKEVERFIREMRKGLK